MCGIAGFSLNKASKINARALSHALLAQIEVRGRMSSGFGSSDAEGNIVVHKDAVRGSSLPLKGMRRDAKTVVLHTRYATLGSPQVNENNHPVWSPNSSLALVHNGVIWNNTTIRAGLLEGIEMPQVDTAVIPALIETLGLGGIRHLAGDAAVAWLDAGDTEDLHLARIESSPVSYTNLVDGSFVFASTPTLLRNALEALNLTHGEVFAMAELDYYRIRGGVIMNLLELPETQGYGQGWAASTRDATSGGHGNTTTVPIPTVTPITPAKYGSVSPDDYSIYDSIVDQEMRKEEKIAQDALDAADRMNTEPMFKVPFNDGTGQIDPDESGDGFTPFEGPRFYTVDTDGAMETYDDLDELETRLLYLAGKSGDDGLGAGKEKWINHFVDLGTFGFEGEMKLISWVEEPNEIAVFDDPNGDGLEYVRDGIYLLQNLAGR